MKRFCPFCGFDQFGRILPPDAPDGPGGRMTCDECGAAFDTSRLQELSRKPAWWYWLVLPMLVLPALIVLVAPQIDRLLPGRRLDAGLTFWALAASPLYLYVMCAWIFASHRLARWCFGAIPAAIVLTVLNLLLAAAAFILRS